MSEIFYRWQRTDLPEFSADHAYSGIWGYRTYSADGSQAECLSCDGTGEWCGETCPDCSGEGWEDQDYGYSCCWSAQDLVAYFRQHLLSGADDTPGEGEVIVLAGEQTGNGCDG
jgi:hypothetical protein